MAVVRAPAKITDQKRTVRKISLEVVDLVVREAEDQLN